MHNAFVADKWLDYQIIDAGEGEKLERWGPVTVVRPDPQIIWPRMLPSGDWTPHMHYRRSKSGGGHWEHLRKSPERWTISYCGLDFIVRPTDFKHMGLFPEQAANWDWLMELIKSAGRPLRVLNLFGYTGGASLCCLHAGAELTHVDAAKGMNEWAKENMRGAGLQCRLITDDVYKFVQREQRRGNCYDGIILDPPSYGRGPRGELWKLEDRLFALLCACVEILSDRASFMLLNTYTTGFTSIAAENVLRIALGKRGVKGDIASAALALPVGGGELLLPCGSSVRFVAG